MAWAFVKACPLIHQVLHSLKKVIHFVPAKLLVTNPLLEPLLKEFHQEVVQQVGPEQIRVEGTVVQHLLVSD